MEKEDKVIAITNLLRILNDPLVVFDVGVRWGFQEHWKHLEPYVKLIGIDADEQEVKQLEKNEKTEDKFVPKVLGAKNGRGIIHLTQNPACSSLYHPDAELIRKRPGMSDTSLISTKEVNISTLDDWAKNKGVTKADFMKLDVQGAELDILKGSKNILGSVRAVEVEVQFNPLYIGVPLFGDVDRYLRRQGFSLWRIRNFSHYHLAGADLKYDTEEIINFDSFPVKFNGRGGQLFWGDAFYVHEEIAMESPRPWEKILKDSCIMGVLGFTDIYTASLREVLQSCPEDVAQKIKAAFKPNDPILHWIEQGDITDKDGNITAKGYDFTETHTVHRLETELNTVRADLEQARQKINAYHGSRSYKITAPLRMVFNFIRNLCKKT